MGTCRKKYKKCRYFEMDDHVHCIPGRFIFNLIETCKKDYYIFFVRYPRRKESR